MDSLSAISTRHATQSEPVAGLPAYGREERTERLAASAVPTLIADFSRCTI